MPTLKLYVKTGCPYCAVVLKKLHDEEIPFEELNIKESENRQAVIDQGGESKVPFLVDSTHGISMYESRLILGYLDRFYIKGKFKANPTETAKGSTSSSF